MGARECKRKRSSVQRLQESTKETTNQIPGGPCIVCNELRSAQWRLGPDGRRNLCNACGIRWTRGNEPRLPAHPGTAATAATAAAAAAAVAEPVHCYVADVGAAEGAPVPPEDVVEVLPRLDDGHASQSDRETSPQEAQGQSQGRSKRQRKSPKHLTECFIFDNPTSPSVHGAEAQTAAPSCGNMTHQDSSGDESPRQPTIMPMTLDLCPSGSLDERLWVTMEPEKAVQRPLTDTAACMGAEVLTSLWYHSKVQGIYA